MKKAGTKGYILHDSLYKTFRRDTTIELESRWVVAKGWGRGGWVSAVGTCTYIRKARTSVPVELGWAPLLAPGDGHQLWKLLKSCCLGDFNQGFIYIGTTDQIIGHKDWTQSSASPSSLPGGGGIGLKVPTFYSRGWFFWWPATILKLSRGPPTVTSLA